MPKVYMNEAPVVQTVGADGIGVSPPVPVEKVEKISGNTRGMEEVVPPVNRIPNPIDVGDGAVIQEKNNAWQTGADLPDPANATDGMVLAVEDGKYIIADSSVQTDVADLVADPYDPNSTYDVGDIVVYQNKLYVCKTAITTAEAWTAAHWDEKNMAEALEDGLASQSEKIDELKTAFNDNLYGGHYYEADKKINASRQIIDAEGYCVTDFFEVTGGTSITISCNGSSSETLYGLEYAADKTIIDRWGIAVETRTFNLTANAKYFRFTFTEGYAAKAVQNSQEIYIADTNGLVKDILDTVPDTVADTIYTLGVNKFNPNTTESGYIDGSGVVTSSADYFTSDFIDVSGFTHGYAFTPKARRILFFDALKTPIVASYHANETAASVITLDASYKYVRFSWYKTSTDVMVADASTMPPYEPYEVIAKDGVNYLNAETEQNVKTLANGGILAGKKWAVCGDSFTAGADSGTLPDGKYAGHNIVYPYIIGNRTGIDVLDFFANGRTLAMPETAGDFVNSLTCTTASYYYQNIPEDVDYITIYLGINDEHHADGDSGSDGEDTTGLIPIGTISDNTTATYYGAWNVVLTWLITNRPFAHIGIIVTNGVTAPYREAQIAIAKKYGIPYMDMNGNQFTPCMIRSCNTDVDATIRAAIQAKQAVNYPTNTHPNNATHQFESTFIEAFLKSL